MGGPPRSRSHRLTNSRKLSNEGNKLLEQQQPELAEAKLREAVNACPSDSDARRYYAEALWRRNARREAVAQLEEACRLNPDPDLRVHLADKYREMGRLDEAGQIADDCLGRNFKLAAAWRVRGSVRRLRGDGLLAAGNPDAARTAYLLALADLHRAAGYDPADKQAMGETAAVYRSLGQPQRALETMQCLLETYVLGEEPQEVSVLDRAGLHGPEPQRRRRGKPQRGHDAEMSHGGVVL